MKNETPVSKLKESQRERASIIKITNAQKSQIIAYIARHLCYGTELPETKRKAVWEFAEKMYSSIAKDKKLEKYSTAVAEICKIPIQDVIDICKVPVLAVETSITMLKDQRADIEKTMVSFAKLLPVYDWWISMRGRGAMGLAIIIGESGDLSNYSTPAKLWKRFGLAVIDDVRQGGLPKGSAAEAWISHGYCKRRRSVLWTIGDSLMKTNGKDGFYKQLYNETKIREAAKLLEMWIADGKEKDKFKPLHSHRRAQRNMEKRLLRHLWNKWNGIEDTDFVNMKDAG